MEFVAATTSQPGAGNLIFEGGLSKLPYVNAPSALSRVQPNWAQYIPGNYNRWEKREFAANLKDRYILWMA